MTEAPILVAVDIDSTIIPHTYPDFDPDTILPGCLETLQAICAMNSRVGIILFSMRHTGYYRSTPGYESQDNTGRPRALEPIWRPTVNDDTITPVAEYLKANGVRVHGINEAPGQWRWTNSPKAYYHVSVDDRNLGMPLTDAGNVDWSIVGPMLQRRVEELIQG